MASGGMSVIKFLLFAFNLLFLISGISLIVIGALSLKHLSKYADFLADKNTSPTMLIAVGSIVFVLSFLGCCGAWKENYCMLMTFAVLLFLIFAVELAAGIAAYIYRKDVGKAIKEEMKNDLKKEKPENNWEEIQTDLKCCGVVNASDWNDVHGYSNGTLPPSCCPDAKPSCNISDDNKYEQGCAKALKNFLEDKIYILGGVGVGVAFIQLLGITFACCLACDKDKRY